MKKILVHTTATALLLSQLGMANTTFAAENETTSNTESIQKEEPTLVKGDFFYFVKMTIEKMELLLTTDKVKEAKLLAEFAQERILEAQVLIKEGKEDLAKESLKEALTQMEVAQGQVDVKLPTTETTNTTTETTTETTTTQPAEEATETEKEEVEKEEVEKEEVEKEEVEKEEVEKEEAEKVEKKKLTKEQKEIAKIQHHLNTNLLVLANVLDQVKNPKAKAAIAKNIEKSFNKISERLEKLLKNSEQEEAILNPTITVQYPESSTESTTPEVITTITKIEDVEDEDTNTEDVNEENDDKEDSTEAVKPAKVKHNNGNHYGQLKKEQKPVKVKKEKVEKEDQDDQEEKHTNGKKQNHQGNHEKSEKQWKEKNHKANDREDNERGNKDK
jgi:hypothetical protein